MPKIPQYQGEKKIAPQRIAPRVPPGLMSGYGQAIEKVGDALLAVEEQTRKVRTVHEVTRSTVEANKQIMQIQTEALQDPDLDRTLPEYQARIRQVANESGNMISDPMARLQFNARMSTDITALDFKLGAEARKTLSVKAKAALEDSIEIAKERYHQAPNQKLKEQIEQQVNMEILEHVESKAINPLEGKKLLESLGDDFRISDIEKRISADPESARQILRAGQHGIDDPKKVQELLKKADAAFHKQIKAGEKLLSDMHDRNEMDMMNLLMDDKLSLELVESMANTSDVTPDFAAALEENLLSDKRYVEVSDKRIENELHKQVYSDKGRTSKDTRELMLDLIKANTRGELTVEDMRAMAGVIDSEFQDASLKARNNLFGRYWRMIEKWVNTIGDGHPETILRMSKKAIEKFQKGDIDEKEMSQEVKGLIQEEIRRQRPELLAVEGEVDAIADEGGISQLTDTEVPAEIEEAKKKAEAAGKILVRQKSDGVFGTITPKEYEEAKEQFDKF